MKIFKKNQIIIYVIVLLLMTAGYLNYTTNTKTQALETSLQMSSNDDSQTSNIGDATLVSSNDVETNTADKNVVETNEVNSNTTANANIDTNTTSNSADTNTVDENVVSTSSSNTDEYFTKSKLERDTMYSQMIENYEKILNSSNSAETQKQTATEEIKKINDTQNSIMICENLIETKGFKNNVIFVNGDSISVIIGADDLKPEEIAQIQNIISREMNAKVENIHISNK